MSRAWAGLRVGLWAVCCALTLGISGCSGGGDESPSVPEPNFRELQITPSTESAPRTVAAVYQAFALYDDNSIRDVTSQARWSVADPNVASVSSGRAIGTQVGATKVMAEFGGKTAEALFTVTAAEPVALQVTPAQNKIPRGVRRQFTAMATFNDGSVADVTSQSTWEAKDPRIVALGNTAPDKGRAYGESPGRTEIKAVYNDKLSDAVELEVTDATVRGVTVTPTFPAIVKGTKLDFSAVAVFSDDTHHDVTEESLWSATDGAVASVSNTAPRRGQVTGTGVGKTDVKAAFQGNSGAATLEVKPARVTAIEISPAQLEIPKGVSQPFKALALFTDDTTQDVTADTTWTSSDTNIATVNNAPGQPEHGRVDAKNPGSAEITAVYVFEGQSFTKKAPLIVGNAVIERIKITPEQRSLPRGLTQQFEATAVYSDKTERNVTSEAVWTSQHPHFATISNAAAERGLASATRDPSKGGSTVITASIGSVSAQALLDVTSAVVSKVAVTPATASVPKGLTQAFKAIASYSDDSAPQDITHQVTWTSSHPNLAEIGNADPAKGLAVGREVSAQAVTISASFEGIKGVAALNVTDATLSSIQVDPVYDANPVNKLPVSFEQRFTATGIYSDGSHRDLTQAVTWKSSREDKASITNDPAHKGYVIGREAGLVTFSAVLEQIEGRRQMEVTSATLRTLVVSAKGGQTDPLPKGLTRALKATGTFSDDSTLDLTAQSMWASSEPSTADVSNAEGSKGVVTAKNPGQVIITALRGVHGALPLIVSAATLQRIVVQPSNAVICPQARLAYTAHGYYSDNTVSTITRDVTWSIEDASQSSGITIDNTDANSKGTVTAGDTAAQVTVKAERDGVRESVPLTVSPGEVTAVTVAPVTVDLGKTAQAIAHAEYSGCPRKEVTKEVTWTTLNPDVASVSNSAGSEGLVSGNAPGSTSIVATYPSNQRSGSASVTVE